MLHLCPLLPELLLDLLLPVQSLSSDPFSGRGDRGRVPEGGGGIDLGTARGRDRGRGSDWCWDWEGRRCCWPSRRGSSGSWLRSWSSCLHCCCRGPGYGQGCLEGDNLGGSLYLPSGPLGCTLGPLLFSPSLPWGRGRSSGVRGNRGSGGSRCSCLPLIPSSSCSSLPSLHCTYDDIYYSLTPII